jgi:hypothetical protein
MRWGLVLFAAVVLVPSLAGCDTGPPRVTVLNDTKASEHVFYCWDDSCTQGISGNDAVLKPGESDIDYWNSPDAVGQVGVATYPDDRLIGCLYNPSPGVDAPAPTTLRTSRLGQCGPTPLESHPKVQLINPG